MRPLAVLVSLVFTLSALAQQQPVDVKAVDRAMLATMKAWHIPGAAIAVVKNDRVVFLSGYGTKEVGGTDPVTPDTLFQIASTSKAFTTAALAMLVDEGKVAWDDPVRKHVAYFKLADVCADANVTVRDIVSHRTGLSRHDELWDNSPWSREEVIRRIGSVELSKPFRSAYQYQNIMFIAAGEVVAGASKSTWDDFMRRRLFEPLHMTRTVTSDAEWTKSDHASGHRYDWKENRVTVQRPIDTTTIGAGGGIKSTARDMANWLRFQLGNGVFEGTQLVGEEALLETRTPQIVVRMENLTRDANPETNVMSYGLGWVVQDYRGELLVSHAGALNGFRTHVDLLPKRNSGFVIMANAGRGMALIALRNSLADILSGKPPRDWNAYYLMIERKADEKEEKEKTDRKARRVANAPPSRPLDAYAGVYEGAAYGPAKVSLVNGNLVLEWSRMTVPLAHFQFDVFSAESEYHEIDEQVVFGVGATGSVDSLTLFGEKFVRKAPSIPPDARQSGR